MTAERRYDPNNPSKRAAEPKSRRVVLPGPAETDLKTDILTPVAEGPEGPEWYSRRVAAVSRGPEWHSRRDTAPAAVSDRRTLVERASVQVPAIEDAALTGQLIAAVIIAEALDRLGDKIIEACAVLNYRR